MASGLYGPGVVAVMDGTFNLDTATIKVMLIGVNTAFTYAPGLALIDNGGNDGTDPSFCELVATDYTGGFAGSGRKTTGIVISYDSGNDRVKVVHDTLTWTGLGGAVNDTVSHALLVWENTVDTDSIPILCWDNTNITTNDTDLILTASSDGNWQIPMS